MEGNVIASIGEEDFPEKDWKVTGIEKILNSLDIKPEETLAIGDSLADKPVFELAGESIAINPKGGIEKYEKYIIEGNLALAIDIIKGINSNNIEGSKRK